MTAVRIVAPIVLGFSFSYLFNSYYVYLGREGLSTATAVLPGIVLPCVLVPLFGACFGLTGVWTGLAASPYVALTLILVYLFRREDPRSVPLLLPVDLGALKVFDLTLDKAHICAASADVGGYLKGEGVDPRRVAQASLLVEEALMIVFERNAGHRVCAEVTVSIREGEVRLVLRDDGEIFDITDADAAVSSLRVYLVSNLMTTIPNRRNLTTTGFNRNVFVMGQV